MYNLILPGTDVGASRLGFGCARLMRIPRRKERKNIVAAALDAGITYFDVAPMYGMGVAEAELAHCLGNRRHDVTIATKFGIEARSGIFGSSLVQGAARRVLSVFPGLKRLVRRNADLMIKARHYDVAAGKKSLERSLAALGVGRVGVLLLHEPTAEELYDLDLLPWLESLRKDGRVGAWGIAGEASRTARVVEAIPQLVPVIQFDCDALNRQIERMPADGRRAFVTYSPMLDLHERIRLQLTADPGLMERWTVATGEDFSRPDTIARFLLTYAVRANHNGVVLYSTSSPKRIAQAAHWVENDNLVDDAFASFQNLLYATFPPRGQA